MSGGDVAATTSVGSGGTHEGYRDRDPPPAFDGKEDGFKVYLRELELWRHETDVPRNKQGAKVLRQLTGSAKAVIDELSIAEITSEQGIDKIVAALKVYFQPHLETAIPRALEKAVYAEGRKSKESLGEYLIRMDAGFRELASEGIKLEDQVKGYVIFRHAALSQVQEDQVTTWTQGKFDREDIVKAIRKLEKVQKEKGGSRNFVTEEESYAEFEEQDEDSEDYVYVGERDLEEILDEEEVQEALASYQRVRKAIKDQRTSRGYYDSRSSGGRGKGSGSGKGGKLSFSMGSGRIQFKGGGQGHGAKVHIDMLKLRTRCAKCGIIGHWAKECPNEPDARARQRQESMSGKTGFCEMGVSEEKGRAVHLFESFDSRQPLTLGNFFHRQVLRSPNSSAANFHGITASSEHGVVDTAAQGGLIGRSSLERLEAALNRVGLKVLHTNKVAHARGIGGSAQACGVAEIPVGVGGINGLIEATVVAEEVPLLLSIKFLKAIDAVVDLCHGELGLNKFGVKTPLHHLRSGHVAVDVLNFDSNGWGLPDDSACAHRKTADFLCDPTAMIAEVRYSSGVQGAPQSHHLCRAGHGMRRVSQQEAPATAGGGLERNPRRAWRNWRVVLQKIYDLLVFVEAQARLESWQEGGSFFGSAVPCTSLGPGLGPSSQHEPVSKEKKFKAEVFQEMIRHGEALGVRKSKEAPAATPDMCPHPASMLQGSGNQSQREVWCKQCHMRWLVDPNAMTDLMKGNPTVTVGGKVLFSGKSTAATAPLPKTALRSPTASTLRSPTASTLRSPAATPPRMPASTASSLGVTSPRSTLTTAPRMIKCKCEVEANRLRVKKEGPNQGRHFYRCHRSLCDFFLWDPEETQEMLRQEEMEKAYRREAQLKQEMKHQIQERMLENERLHREADAQRMEECRLQMEHLHSNLVWMTAAAGEERIQELMSNPALQEEVNKQAQALRRNMENIQQAAEAPDQDMESGVGSWDRC